MNDAIKRLSPAIIVVTILIGAGVIIGALVFGDDGSDALENVADKMAVTQPMELRGDWLGMSLVDLTSASARRANIPPGVKGVMVMESSESMGWRPRQAGVMPRDVLISINKKKITDINDFYDVSRKVDVTQAIFLETSRWGQPMTLVIPAVYRPAMPGQPGQMMGANGMPVQQAWPQQQMAGQPQAWPQQQMAGQPQAWPQQPVAGQPQAWPQQQMTGQPQAWPQQAAQVALQPNAQGAGAAQGPLWVCPRHGLGWPQHLVQPNFRCPLCNGQLKVAR
jgi:hypothetical protein